MLPAGFYRYGVKQKSPGHTPGWLQRMLDASTLSDETCNQEQPPAQQKGSATAISVIPEPSGDDLVESTPDLLEGLSKLFDSGLAEDDQLRVRQLWGWGC